MKLNMNEHSMNDKSHNNTGCPNKHGNSVTNSISSLLWISIVIPYFWRHSIIMSARVYLMKTVNDRKDVTTMSLPRWTVKTDKFTLFVFCNFLVLLSTTVCSQNINKQIVNIAEENLTDYSFLSRDHYTKSKNYLKRRYRIRHWIPVFIGTPCIIKCTWPPTRSGKAWSHDEKHEGRLDEKTSWLI